MIANDQHYHNNRFHEQQLASPHGAQIYSQGWESGYQAGLCERSNRRWEIVAVVVIVALVVGFAFGWMLP